MLCDSWMSLDFLCSSASFLTLSMMSIERYKMLTNSYAHIKYSSKLRIAVFICLSWLVPLVSWLPTIIVSRHLTPQININPYDCSLQADRWLILGLCVFVYHIPIICMVAFYTKLIVYIKKSSSSNLVDSTVSQQLSSSQQSPPQRRVDASPKAGNKLENSFYNSNGDSENGRNNSLANYYENEINQNNFYQTLKINRNEKTGATTKNNISNRSNNIYYLPNCNTNTSKSRTESRESCIYKLKLFLPCCLFNEKPKVNQQSQKTLLRKSTQNHPSPRKVLLRTNKNLNIQEIIPKSNLQQENRKQSKSLEFEQCHFTINSRSHNNTETNCCAGYNNHYTENEFEPALKASRSYTMNGAMMMNPKEFSSEIMASRDTLNNTNNRRFSLVSTLKAGVNRGESSSAQMKIYENSSYQNLRLKRNRKAARMLGILVAAFSICWLPFTIYYPLSQFYPNLLPHGANIVIWWMGYLNSTINPFLYVYSNKNIRFILLLSMSIIIINMFFNCCHSLLLRRSVRILFCQRLWNSCTGRPTTKNFRSDSLKNHVAIFPNGLITPNIYRSPRNNNININIPF